MADKKNYELNEDDLDKAAGGVSVNNSQFQTNAGTVGYTGTTFTFGSGASKDQAQAQAGTVGFGASTFSSCGVSKDQDAIQGGTQGNDVTSINTMNPLNSDIDM